MSLSQPAIIGLSVAGSLLAAAGITIGVLAGEGIIPIKSSKSGSASSSSRSSGSSASASLTSQLAAWTIPDSVKITKITDNSGTTVLKQLTVKFTRQTTIPTINWANLTNLPTLIAVRTIVAVWSKMSTDTGGQHVVLYQTTGGGFQVGLGTSYSSDSTISVTINYVSQNSPSSFTEISDFNGVFYDLTVGQNDSLNKNVTFS